MKTDTYWGNIFRKGPPAEEELLLVLASNPFFEDLSKRELKKIERIVHRRTYTPGEEIFRENQPGAGMYIIKSGSVDVLMSLEGGGTRTLAHLEEGDFTGEMTLLDEAPRSASAVACEETEIIGFFRPDLFGLLERDPRLGLKIVLRLSHMMAERLRYTNREVRELERRIARANGENVEREAETEGTDDRTSPKRI